MVQPIFAFNMPIFLDVKLLVKLQILCIISHVGYRLRFEPGLFQAGGPGKARSREAEKAFGAAVRAEDG